MKSEIERSPRLFQSVDSIPGLTWPTIIFDTEMTVFLGKKEVRIMHLGRGHTKGDTVVWLPEEKVLFSGDLVEYQATPYAGDAYLRDWPFTLKRLADLKPKALVPGRGDALTTPIKIEEGIESTKEFVTELYNSVASGAKNKKALNSIYNDVYQQMHSKFGSWVIFEHCMPFDVSRAYDEATKYPDPRIWTAKRDKEMWNLLEN